MYEMSNDASNSDDLSRQMLSMPTLGRHFDLGTVYDAIRDETIHGFSFWNGIDPKNVISNRNAYRTFSIIASDKLSDKFEKLNVSGSLQVSILSGMIKLSGSANYLEKKKKSTSRQSSVHVKLKCRTEIKKLTMEQLDEINLRYPEIKSTGTIGSATHFVTQIQYGAELVFTFTQKLNETENEQEVNEQLKLSAKKFLEFLMLNGNVDGADTDQENENNIECIFLSDFELPDDVGRPTTYNEAIEFAKKFLQFSSDWMDKDPSDGNKSLGVPVIVWLYPLQDAQGAPVLRHEISLTLSSQCVLIMENYSQLDDEIVLMLEDSLLNKLSPLQKKLQVFQRCLASFIAELKRKLGEMVVGIRSGQDTAADSFRQLTTRITNEQFPFNFNHLNQWLDQKHKELCLVKSCQDRLENQSKVLFFATQEEMVKFPVDFGFEYSFSYLSLPESFLDQLNQPLGTNYFNEISSTTNDLNDFWYENDSVIERIQKEIAIFAELVNVKSNDKKFAFAMTAPDEYNEICATQFSIIVHQEKKRIFGWDAVLIACQHYPKERIFDVFQSYIEHFSSEKLIDVVRLLVGKQIPDGWNALHHVCCYYKNENLIDIIRLLIEKNIDVNCKNNHGWNALHLVCYHYQKENLIDIFRLLIDKNIDVNCKDNYGRNALHVLCYHYQNENLIDIVRLLIDKNNDVNCKDYFGQNARFYLLSRFKEEEVANVLQLLDS